MSEIRSHIVKRGKRNVLSRSLHAKDNEKDIAAWKVDLGRIRRALDVCPFICVSAWRPLTVSFQAELGVNTDADVHGISNEVPNTRMATFSLHRDVLSISIPEVPRFSKTDADVAVSRTHHNVVHPKPIIPKARSDHADGLSTSSSIHHSPLENKGDGDGQNRAVSITTGYPACCRIVTHHASYIIGHRSPPSLTLGEHPRPALGAIPNHLHPAHLVNLLLLCQEICPGITWTSAATLQKPGSSFPKFDATWMRYSIYYKVGRIGVVKIGQ